jgi:hypothetical protein
MNNKSTSIKHNRRILLALVAILAVMLSACGGDGGASMADEEESGTELALDESYDKVRNGARLCLSYDAESNTFIGSAEKTTGNILKQVRVEVHLSNGTGLGPTTPTDLNPGERIEIRLEATNDDFDGWTAHPEVGEGGGKHGHSEGGNEHGQEGDGEHSKGGSSK